jgi:hypothetical protein
VEKGEEIGRGDRERRDRQIERERESRGEIGR